MIKRLIGIVLAALLLVSVMAGCGGDAPAANESSSEAGSSAQKPSETDGNSPAASDPEKSEPEPEPSQSEPEPTGPVALDQVIYEANGIRVTAVQGESFLYKLDSLSSDQEIYRLDLKLEATAAEHSSLWLNEITVNEWIPEMYYGYYDFSRAGGLPNAIDPYLSEGTEETLTISVKKRFLETFGGDDVGRIGLLFRESTPDGGYYNTLMSAKLSDSVQIPEGSASFVASPDDYTQYFLLQVTNPLDQAVRMDFLFSGTDVNGEKAYSFERANSVEQYVDSGRITVSIRANAENQYTTQNSDDLSWYDKEQNKLYELGDGSFTFIGFRKSFGTDISSLVTAEAAVPESSSVRQTDITFTWSEKPEEAETTMISGTLVVLDGDGKVLGFGKGYAMKDSSGVNGTFDENAGVLSGCTAGFPYDIDMSAVSQVLYLIDYAYTY